MEILQLIVEIYLSIALTLFFIMSFLKTRNIDKQWDKVEKENQKRKEQVDERLKNIKLDTEQIKLKYDLERHIRKKYNKKNNL